MPVCGWCVDSKHQDRDSNAQDQEQDTRSQKKKKKKNVHLDQVRCTGAHPQS